MVIDFTCGGMLYWSQSGLKLHEYRFDSYCLQDVIQRDQSISNPVYDPELLGEDSKFK